MTRTAAPTVRDVYEALDAVWPFAHRADWDNVGILLGDPGQHAGRILVALDASPAAVHRLIRSKSDLLVTHHPAIFSPLKSLRPDNPASAGAFALVRAGAAVISAHTNADAAPRGVSWAIARRLGLEGISPLVPDEPSGDACKVVVFVPSDNAASVLAALSGAGAGRIGEYSDCAFSSVGTGTFVPSGNAAPAIGEPGRPISVDELRLETVVAGADLPRVLRRLRDAHPYEEPAIDVYPLKGGSLGGGYGAVGLLPDPLPLPEALDLLRRRLRCDGGIRVAGPQRRVVRRVAIVGGSGAEFAQAAAGAGADLFVTGDVKFHQAQEAASAGITVADVGHGAAEKWILPEFRRVIAEAFGPAATIRIFDEKEPLRPWRPGEIQGGVKS
ncbi:MAG TPA: Nif3-like dinuclear metal center hexameric protein [Candidatus Deferrimicrobiaceae bacterium]